MPNTVLRFDVRKGRLLTGLFLLALSTVSIFALAPPPAIPQPFHLWDKLQHGIAYAALAWLGGMAFPSRHLLLICGLILHGAAIEVMQAALTSTRHGDPRDWLADCMGIAIGLLALAAWKRWAPRSARSAR